MKYLKNNNTKMNNVHNFEDFLLNEKKKMNAGLRAYLDKKVSKKEDKDDDKKDSKKKDKECDDNDECEDDDDKKVGLTPKQKKLPEGLQKAILAKQKKDKK
jgi:hypothetical protein